MNREAALAGARAHFDVGAFVRDLARRVAVRSASQDADSSPALQGFFKGGVVAGLNADVGNFQDHGRLRSVWEATGRV